MEKYDAIVIGFGKGGKTLTGFLAKSGKKVALIEQSEKMFGGTCINVGCIPSKSLVTSSKKAKLHKEWDMNRKEEFYSSAVEQKDKVTSLLRDKNYHKLADLPNVTIYLGVGSFTSPTSVKVTMKDKEVELNAPLIFINTGSTPIVPPIEGIKDNPHVFLSESLMDNKKLPKDLVIIGGGYISMEFASMYANFGSKVTVIQKDEAFLPREDKDVSSAIKDLLMNQGVSFILSADIYKIEDDKVLYMKDGQKEEIKGDAILLATGRKPNVDKLDLSKANIELTPRGGIKVDERLHTSTKGIYALGDVNGGLQFTYVSLDDFRIVKDDLMHKENGRTLKDRINVPYSVFMDIPLGRVGLTEAQAEERKLNYRVVSIPTSSIPKAHVLNEKGGLLKAVISKDDNSILGVSLLCPEAYEMINIVAMAMDLKFPYTYLGNFIFTHPTMSEALNDLFA